ncbi:hypothetical protein ACFRCI_14295 [Streptomyces sp. NPDC056638]|uniref:hypothetical protein n=1 Tax=Streptomyces sp. NPDC056638 TaxID=3345887 RepID=UPI003696A75E
MSSASWRRRSQGSFSAWRQLWAGLPGAYAMVLPGVYLPLVVMLGREVRSSSRRRQPAPRTP